MNEEIIVAVVGLPGSGKSEVVKEFVNRNFVRVGFNDIVYQELASRGIKTTEENERRIREELRKKYGMGVMAKKSLPAVKKALEENRNIVIESLYSKNNWQPLNLQFPDSF